MSCEKEVKYLASRYGVAMDSESKQQLLAKRLIDDEITNRV